VREILKTLVSPGIAIPIAKREIPGWLKTNGSVASPRRVVDGGDSSEPHTGKLARLIAANAPHDGSFGLRIPGVHAVAFYEFS
jgi:hypothetical protein